MQDLNIINKLNAEAVQRDIPTQQRNGHYVVAEYAGLNFVGYSTHPTEAAANAHACEIGKQPGARTAVFAPTNRDTQLPLDLAV